MVGEWYEGMTDGIDGLLEEDTGMRDSVVRLNRESIELMRVSHWASARVGEEICNT